MGKLEYQARISDYEFRGTTRHAKSHGGSHPPSPKGLRRDRSRPHLVAKHAAWAVVRSRRGRTPIGLNPTISGIEGS